MMESRAGSPPSQKQDFNPRAEIRAGIPMRRLQQGVEHRLPSGSGIGVLLNGQPLLPSYLFWHSCQPLVFYWVAKRDGRGVNFFVTKAKKCKTHNTPQVLLCPMRSPLLQIGDQWARQLSAKKFLIHLHNPTRPLPLYSWRSPPINNNQHCLRYERTEQESTAGNSSNNYAGPPPTDFVDFRPCPPTYDRSEATAAKTSGSDEECVFDSKEMTRCYSPPEDDLPPSHL